MNICNIETTPAPSNHYFEFEWIRHPIHGSNKILRDFFQTQQSASSIFIILNTFHKNISHKMKKTEENKSWISTKNEYSSIWLKSAQFNLIQSNPLIDSNKIFCFAIRESIINETIQVKGNRFIRTEFSSQGKQDMTKFYKMWN